MAITPKPLFNRHLLNSHMGDFTPDLTQNQRAIVNDWAEIADQLRFANLKGKGWEETAKNLHVIQAKRLNEKPLQGVFLTRVFDDLLGYRQVVGHGEAYEMKPFPL